MPGPYPREFREDVVAVARSRESGVTIKQVATDFRCGSMRYGTPPPPRSIDEEHSRFLILWRQISPLLDVAGRAVPEPPVSTTR